MKNFVVIILALMPFVAFSQNATTLPIKGIVQDTVVKAYEYEPQAVLDSTTGQYKAVLVPIQEVQPDTILIFRFFMEQFTPDGKSRLFEIPELSFRRIGNRSGKTNSTIKDD